MVTAADSELEVGYEDGYPAIPARSMQVKLVDKGLSAAE